MYPSVRAPQAAQGQAISLVGGPGRGLRVSRNVVYLGLNSMFTDISSEMVNAILPLYLTVQLGFGPLGFGLFLGAYQGVTALGRLGGGIVGDRGDRHKQVATAGYAVSALCKVGVVIAGGASLVTSLFLYVDRLGKGVRTTPRDALISLSSDPARLGEAFGVHRALDTAGAVIGPLVAFLVLAIVPLGFGWIFGVSFIFALIGLAIIFFLVTNTRGNPQTEGKNRASLREALRLFRIPAVRTLVVVAAGLGLATVSDAFVYLTLQHRLELNLGLFPLLYVGTATFYLILALPAGRIADRFGRARVFLGGYGLLFLVYVLLIGAQFGTFLTVFVTLLVLGAYYASTDGVLMAVSSMVLPELRRGSGIALITTSLTLAQFLSSLAFGALWAWRGPQVAVEVFALALLAVLTVAAVAIPRYASDEAIAA